MKAIKYIKMCGYLAIVISLATWALDLTELVNKCAFCRTQRTIIGILGVFMILPFNTSEIIKYVSIVFGVFGTHVSCQQIWGYFHNYLRGDTAVLAYTIDRV